MTTSVISGAALAHLGRRVAELPPANRRAIVDGLLHQCAWDDELDEQSAARILSVLGLTVDQNAIDDAIHAARKIAGYEDRTADPHDDFDLRPSAHRRDVYQWAIEHYEGVYDAAVAVLAEPAPAADLAVIGRAYVTDMTGVRL